MEVKQIYQIINNVTSEVLGKTDLIEEDLGNIVDVGTSIIDADAVDGYVRSLVNHIGRVIFVNRTYSGSVPSVLMDGWEFGSIMEKITAELPEATENESWELDDGVSYDPNIFYKPTVSAKFYNSKVTFEIPMSFTEKQVKQSFSNAEQLNGFMSMLYNAIDKSMTVKLDALIMRTINNMTAETFYSDFGSSAAGSTSGVKAVNLLYLFNQKYHGETTEDYLTAAESCQNADFIRFASYTIGLYKDRMSKISTLFNIGGKDRFTPADMLHVVMLSDFSNGAKAFLNSDTFHDEFVELPKAEVVPYWQGSGTGYTFDKTSKIDVVTTNEHDVSLSGILCVMFDRDALGVTNMDRRVTSNYNPKAEFYNNWYKMDAGYFNDLNENFVVFFVADAA